MRVYHPAGCSASPAADWHLCIGSWNIKWDGWMCTKETLNGSGGLCPNKPCDSSAAAVRGKGLAEETWQEPACSQQYSQQRMSSASFPAGCGANISSREVWEGDSFLPQACLLQAMEHHPVERLPKEGPLPPFP